jgi:hypothetical protein
MNDLLQNAPCCPIAVVACCSGSSADDHHVCCSITLFPESDVHDRYQMVVTSVRDYLRKMSEAAEKPPPGTRGSVRMSSPGDGSTVSAPTEYDNQDAILIVQRNGLQRPQ